VQTLTLEQAAAKRWDCILIGSSFAAMFFAYGLNRRPGGGGSILFVERGQYASHAAQIQNIDSRPYERFSQANSSGRAKQWIASRIFGGNSNCWSGCVPRLHPNEFRTRTLHGVGVDWPISYDDIERHYCVVEEVMEIAGGGSEHLLPRSRPFPFPPHAPSVADIMLRRHDPELWVAQPAARSNGGRRSPCCANALCRLCPVDAKFTILNSLDQFQTAGTHFLLGHECRRVVSGAGRVSGVVVCDGTGRERELKADLVGLGANAVQNVAILLRSGLQNEHLGRGLNEQLSRTVTYNVPFANYFGGTHITGNGYCFYDGAFVATRAGVLIEVRNDLEVARRERGKWLNNMRLKFIAGDLINPDNRVVLVDDEPHIEWVGHSAYAHAGLDHAIAEMHSFLPFDHEIAAIADNITEGHIQGMTPMASRREDGVVDAYCQVFGISGLYALGAGVFPTCSPANPTLTLAALALRAGESA
jgi:choline dehydrogenase-like flavoprotein